MQRQRALIVGAYSTLCVVAPSEVKRCFDGLSHVNLTLWM